MSSLLGLFRCKGMRCALIGFSNDDIRIDGRGPCVSATVYPKGFISYLAAKIFESRPSIRCAPALGYWQFSLASSLFSYCRRFAAIGTLHKCSLLKEECSLMVIYSLDVAHPSDFGGAGRPCFNKDASNFFTLTPVLHAIL